MGVLGKLMKGAKGLGSKVGTKMKAARRSLSKTYGVKGGSREGFTPLLSEGKMAAKKAKADSAAFASIAKKAPLNTGARARAMQANQMDAARAQAKQRMGDAALAKNNARLASRQAKMTAKNDAALAKNNKRLAKRQQKQQFKEDTMRKRGQTVGSSSPQITAL